MVEQVPAHSTKHRRLPRCTPRPPAPLPIRLLSSARRSVGDRSLLTRVDLRVRSRLEQERRHVPCEERPRLGIHHIESVVIDQHRLLLSPVCPALPADLVYYAGSNWTGKRRTLEPFTRLATTHTSHFSHAQDLAYSIFARPKSDRKRR